MTDFVLLHPLFMAITITGLGLGLVEARNARKPNRRLVRIRSSQRNRARNEVVHLDLWHGR